MTEHDRLPMPFERARTQLLLGQLQRRQRHRDTARANVGAALAVFDELDTPLWSAKARASLARSDISTGTAKLLTAGERRVAELAASGMTNREVATALFISPKTVEVHLSHVYRKLDVRTRAELSAASTNSTCDPAPWSHGTQRRSPRERNARAKIGAERRHGVTVAKPKANEWARTVSNRRPLVCKTRALPLSYAPVPEAGYTHQARVPNSLSPAKPSAHRSTAVGCGIRRAVSSRRTG